jgi:hypothetical protein
MHGTQMAEVEEDEGEDGTASAQSRQRWDCKYSIPPKAGAMVRLDQEWCHMAMIIMNVQIVRFFSGKIERVCWQYVPYN